MMYMEKEIDIIRDENRKMEKNLELSKNDCD